MKIVYALLPVSILAQDSNSTTTPAPCDDQFAACSSWLLALKTDENPNPECRANWKLNCRKTCGVCEDPEINAALAKQSTTEKVCKDLDDVICSNIKNDPSICITSELHKGTCMKSCNRCDADIMAEMAGSTVAKLDDMMSQLEMFEEKDDTEIMTEFIKNGNCRDIYPDTCQKMVNLDDDKISCANNQLKKLCAESCDSCEEILKPWLDRAKEIGNTEIDAAEKAKDKLNTVVEDLTKETVTVENETNESENLEDPIEESESESNSNLESENSPSEADNSSNQPSTEEENTEPVNEDSDVSEETESTEESEIESESSENEAISGNSEESVDTTVSPRATPGTSSSNSIMCSTLFMVVLTNFLL